MTVRPNHCHFNFLPLYNLYVYIVLFYCIHVYIERLHHNIDINLNTFSVVSNLITFIYMYDLHAGIIVTYSYCCYSDFVEFLSYKLHFSQILLIFAGSQPPDLM